MLAQSPLASMPKVAIDKHGEPPDWYDDVRFTREVRIR
jgi:hypothetical protein